MTRAERELAALRDAVISAPEPIDDVSARGIRWRNRRRARLAVVGLGVAALGTAGVFMAIEPARTTRTVVAGTEQRSGNYLVVGSDARGAGSDSRMGQRADTIMVVHVDSAAETVVAVSLPRDLWVDVAGVGMAKINSAFSHGPDSMIATVEQNFDISIDHYIEVDFTGFRKVVNAVGRVPIYFPYPARDPDAGLSIEAGGCIPLNGREALAYVRARHLEYHATTSDRWVPADAIADIGRISRQQEFLRRLASAVRRKIDDPIAMNEIVDSLVEHLTIDTKLTKDDFLRLVDVLFAIDPEDQRDVEFATIPWTPGEVGGMSVLFPSDEGWLAAELSDDDRPDQAVTTPSASTGVYGIFGPPAKNTERCK